MGQIYLTHNEYTFKQVFFIYWSKDFLQMCDNQIVNKDKSWFLCFQIELSNWICLHRYKDNIKELSELHKDQPIDPLQLSVYWTEFVMRHKGAKHLRPAVHDLNWIQYYCLDVGLFFFTILLLVVVLTVKCLKVCLRKLGGKRKQD